MHSLSYGAGATEPMTRFVPGVLAGGQDQDEQPTTYRVC